MALANINQRKIIWRNFIQDYFLRNKVKAKGGSVWSQRAIFLPLQQQSSKAGHSFMQDHPWDTADSYQPRARKEPSAVPKHRHRVTEPLKLHQEADSEQRYQGQLQSQRLPLSSSQMISHRKSSSIQPQSECGHAPEFLSKCMYNGPITTIIFTCLLLCHSVYHKYICLVWHILRPSLNYELPWPFLHNAVLKFSFFSFFFLSVN